MHEGILRKGLVVGIIMIFLGASAIPSLSGNVTSKFKINSSINSGLVGYWSFNDQNNPGFDDSGNNNQGTLNGVTWTPDGHSGGAVFFDASPDRIAFNSPVINTPPYSVCVWVKPNVFNANSYIICNGGETILHYGFYLMHNQNINSYGFGGYDSDGYGGAAYASYSVLNWTFLCGTWDGTNNPDSMLLYINGIPYAATNMGWWDNGPAANLLFGSPTKDPDLYGFFGIIDEVRIYDRVLSEDEIGELYQNPDINFLVSWLYPESSHDSQIQQYDYYPITLTVQNGLDS